MFIQQVLVGRQIIRIEIKTANFLLQNRHVLQKITINDCERTEKVKFARLTTYNYCKSKFNYIENLYVY